MSARLANLLRKVHQGKTASVLQDDGELLYQVAELISEALNSDLVRYDESRRLCLTGAGKQYLFDADKRREGGVSGWIDPMDSERQSHPSEGDIYIPNKSVIARLRER